MAVRHLIVTGAGGYLGRGLVAAALADGRRVTALARDPGTVPEGARYVPWHLGAPLPATCLDPSLPPDAQALVHLAHDWREQGSGDDRNLSGTRLLRDGARALGLGRTVFASSQSARPDALNAYGRAKWAIEQIFDGPAELSLRIGLVYGGPRAAMYGLLCRLSRLPLLPMIAPDTLVQPIHRDEVARGILLGIDGTSCGPVGLAGPIPISFGDALKTLAARFHGRRLIVVPIPLRLALFGCSAVNALPFGPRVDRERILGLAGTRPMPTQADLDRIGLRVVPLSEGLLREPAARTASLAEGRVLMRYILRAEPGGALMRRYARAVARDGAAPALILNAPLRRWPGLLRFVEPYDRDAPLARRLALAARLAEASPAGEASLARHNRPRRLADLVADGAIETLALPVRAARALLR